MKGTADIWYLYHSGFAVKYGGRLFIFDYYKDRAVDGKADLDGGVFNPKAHLDDEVFVFASHRHGDHFNSVILGWEKQHPKIHYILSDDIPAHGSNVLSVAPEKNYTLAGIQIKTLASTDEGVAFLVRADDLTLYHAGDLHWWHWEGEPDPWNPEMERKYKQQIAQLEGTSIDIAFVPADPRQEGFSHLGICWFLQKTGCNHVFPMHFGDDYGIMQVLEGHPELKPYLSRLHLISKCGQSFRLTDETAEMP